MIFNPSMLAIPLVVFNVHPQCVPARPHMRLIWRAFHFSEAFQIRYIVSYDSRKPLGSYFLRKSWLPEGQFPESCVICLEDLPPDSKVRLLPCGHVFHHPCIDNWLRVRDVRCPICGETFYHLCRPKERSSPSRASRQSSETGHNKFHALKLWCIKVTFGQTRVARTGAS